MPTNIYHHIDFAVKKARSRDYINKGLKNIKHMDVTNRTRNSTVGNGYPDDLVWAMWLNLMVQSSA